MRGFRSGTKYGINKLIREVQREPFSGVGKPEPLRHALLGFWSRRIIDEHRMVYRVVNDVLAACRSAPCKGAVFQRVRSPSGHFRSGRKQLEQSWRQRSG